MDDETGSQEQQRQLSPTVMEATEAGTAAAPSPPESMQEESLQEGPSQELHGQASFTIKRASPEDEPHSEVSGLMQSTNAESAPSLASQEDATEPGSPAHSNKRRRISMPGRSILKSANQEDDRDLTGDQETAEEPTIDSITASEVTETFSSTTEFLKRNRKSIGRRVSFAATARIRMFERDEKEDELPKTMSFLEGLNPQVAQDTPFTFEDGGDSKGSNNQNINDTNDTNDSVTSAQAEQSSHEHSENTEMSTGSSDSEKERSFEVSVYPGNSDSAESSETGTPFFLPSSELDIGKTPFDDGDVDNGSSSEEESSHFFPDVTLMKRSSGVGLYKRHRDSILGPQLDLGQTGDHRLSQRSEQLDDGTQDYSMEYTFQKHRSSIPERLPTPPLHLEKDQDDTADFTMSQQYSEGDRDDSKMDMPSLGTKGQLSNDNPHLGGVSLFASHSDLPSNLLDIGARLDLPMMDALSGDDRSMLDEDTDMDITAPIGAGIQQLAQEMPPSAFHHAQDNTAMFSDLGTPMDITQPFGAGILDARDDPATVEKRRVSQTRSIPSTPVRSARSSIGHSSSNENTHDKHSEDRQHESQKSSENYSQAEVTSAGSPPVPSTPPRRTSSFHGDALSPTSFPRRSLGTPGRFTPSVKARLNIFPEVLEKQLQTLQSSTLTEPVFRASHVSPETSSLAKRIYRYSVGASSRTSGNFEDRLNEERDDTLDLTSFEKRLSSIQSSSNDIFYETNSLVDEDMAHAHQDNTEIGLPDSSTQMTHDEVMVESRDTSQHEVTDEDSFSELPPITLSKFMGLVGVSFLDHLNASTRRRTIPHRAVDAGASTETYRSADLVKAMAISMQELHSYREACRLLKQSIDTSRTFADDQERKVSKRNPDYFREFRESNSDTKEFMKDRFRMIKVHSKLDTNAAFSNWKADVLKVEQETLQQHLIELKKDIVNLGNIGLTLENEKSKVLPRRDELRRQLEQATERQRSYELCDKEQLASLAEAAEEQGAQIEHYESVKAKKSKELAEIRARVEQLRLTEKTTKRRITEAEKTSQKHQYARMEDLCRAKDTLSIIQATHHWEPIRPPNSSSATAAALQRNVSDSRALEFVYDKTLKVSIDVATIGKDPNAVQVSEFEEEHMMDFNLSLADRQRLTISALTPKKPRPIKEYVGLLRDYTMMIAGKYKAGTAINKILSDISQFWTKICLIRRDVELVRAHHVVDLVAGSAENLKELEENNANGANGITKRQVAGSTTPLVVLDIRVRFTGPIAGVRRSARHRGHPDHDDPVMGGADEDDDEGEDGVDGVESRRNGHSSNNDGRSKRNGAAGPMNEPVKFYLWFTFTLNDILNFPGANSFTWRLEVVYGNISQEHVIQAVGPAVRKGGYDVLRETCIKVNQLLRI